MPRSSRLDIPGVLQHVIVRGIERRDIFLDDDDRQNFVDRLAALLAETRMECYAWSLLSNHFHLLLRSRQQQLGSLSSFMRRLLTGYAVSFNRRHRRSGHLFQNRYKSIVCEEEPYLLELVRYIHLNPLRAGLVKDLAALDQYPWGGHCALMGHRTSVPQNCDAVLALFGRTAAAAQSGYRRFVADGVRHGRRDELVGGGIQRMRKLVGEGIGAADERILGSSDFVETLRGTDPPFGRIRLQLDQLIRRTTDAKLEKTGLDRLFNVFRK